MDGTRATPWQHRLTAKLDELVDAAGNHLVLVDQKQLNHDLLRQLQQAQLTGARVLELPDEADRLALLYPQRLDVITFGQLFQAGGRADLHRATHLLLDYLTNYYQQITYRLRLESLDGVLVARTQGRVEIVLPVMSTESVPAVLQPAAATEAALATAHRAVSGEAERPEAGPAYRAALRQLATDIAERQTAQTSLNPQEESHEQRE